MISEERKERKKHIKEMTDAQGHINARTQAKRFKETVLTANLLRIHFSPDSRNRTHVIILAIVFYITQVEQVTGLYAQVEYPASHFSPLLPRPLEKRAREAGNTSKHTIKLGRDAVL